MLSLSYKSDLNHFYKWRMKSELMNISTSKKSTFYLNLAYGKLSHQLRRI
jgi:hypothetical protein